MKHVIEGAIKFRREVFPGLSGLFDRLAKAQSPEVLFITCSDSRIVPGLITQTKPGDLFTCRIAGNIVPPRQNHAGGVLATIEFAVQALEVKHIIICGHYDCAAMAAAMDPASLQDFPHAQEWLVHSKDAVAAVEHAHGDAEQRLDLLCERNVVLQMQHLATHPCVAARLAAGGIELHGWIYDIGSGMIKAYASASDSFIPLE